MRRITALAAGLVFAACSPSPSADTVSVDLEEFAVHTSTSTWSGSGVAVSVTNSGDFGHTLLITDDRGRVVEVVDLVAPGESTHLSLSLPPGRYDLTCRIVVQAGDGRIIDHFEEGMRATVDVVES